MKLPAWQQGNLSPMASGSHQLPVTVRPVSVIGLCRIRCPVCFCKVEGAQHCKSHMNLVLHQSFDCVQLATGDGDRPAHCISRCPTLPAPTRLSERAGALQGCCAGPGPDLCPAGMPLPGSRTCARLQTLPPCLQCPHIAVLGVIFREAP